MAFPPFRPYNKHKTAEHRAKGGNAMVISKNESCTLAD